MGIFDRLLGKKPDYDRFAQEFIRALQAAGAREVQHSAADHSLRIGSANTTFYLDNAFRDYLAAQPSERARVIQGYVRSFSGRTDVPNDYNSSKAALLPIVRDPAYYSLSRLTLEARDANLSKINFVTREIAPGLCVAIAHDTPANILTTGATQLETWNVSFDQAFDQALSNLREKSDPRKLKQLSPGLYVGDWGDYYDTARILIPDMFHRLGLNGDPLVFLPNRSILFVTGAYETALQAVILKNSFPIHFEEGHALSPNCYVHSGGKWQLFVSSDPVVAAQARSFKYRRDAMDYDQQKKDLETINKKKKIDIFVASCQLLKRKDESLFTRCVWTRGVDSLLPVTESLVLLLDLQTKELLDLPWEKAFPTLSPLLEKVPDLIPVRYRAKVFPGPDVIQALRNLKSS